MLVDVDEDVHIRQRKAKAQDTCYAHIHKCACNSGCVDLYIYLEPWEDPKIEPPPNSGLQYTCGPKVDPFFGSPQGPGYKQEVTLSFLDQSRFTGTQS